MTPSTQPRRQADEKRVDLVFEGGGVKGIGLAGAYYHLSQQGFRPERLAGTSAGAITAALVAAGYTGEEMKRLVLEEMRFAPFADRPRFPGSQLLELTEHQGLHPGKYFQDWMRERLAAKGVRTFGDLRHPDASDEDPSTRDHRLQVIASDVSRHRLLVLPRDAGELGLDPDELEVALAVRMSMSIPMFFDPVRHRNPKHPHEHLIVDGGLLSNFPVWLFDSPDGDEPCWPTFGFLLVPSSARDPIAPGPAPPRDAEGKISMRAYVQSIAQTVMEARDRMYVEQGDYARTITIDTLGVHTTQFSIDEDPDLKRRLFESGVAGATAFLSTWDFDSYLRAFRAKPAASRREQVAALMRTGGGSGRVGSA